MRRNRVAVAMLVIVTVLAMATTALAGKPDNPGKPEKPTPPDIWTCAERVQNGASWVPGYWNGVSYVSDATVDVDLPLCIDLNSLAAHKHVVEWTVTWEGTPVLKSPKGLMLIFEEEVHANHYAEIEVSQPGEQRSWEAHLVLPTDVEGNPVNDHLVLVAMPRQGDKWDTISFTVTPTSP